MAIFVWDLFPSQVVWSSRVSEVLANGGHNVTMFPVVSMGHGDLSGYPKHPSIRVFSTITSGQREGVASSSSQPQRNLGFSEFSAEVCERLLTNRKLIDEFLTADFDVVLTHTYNYCPAGLTHMANISSWIWLAGGPLPEYIAQEMAVPTVPSYVRPLHFDATDRMTFFERLRSFVLHSLTPLAHFNHIGPAEDVAFLKAGYMHVPPLRELGRRAPLVMVNNDELFDFPRPGLVKMVNVGGVGVEKTATTALKEPFSTIISSANSIVLFSLGSVVNPSQMLLDMKVAFLKAFTRHPHVTFIFRYDGHDLDGIKPVNVHVFRWIPQAQLLGQPKVRSIITHGGFNSLMEVVNAGKPMVCIPLFGDQFRNCRLAEHRGIARVVQTNEVSEERIHEALQATIDDDRMKFTTQALALAVALMFLSFAIAQAFTVDAAMLRQWAYDVNFTATAMSFLAWTTILFAYGRLF